jgi:hypothetical protein
MFLDLRQDLAPTARLRTVSEHGNSGKYASHIMAVPPIPCLNRLIILMR